MFLQVKFHFFIHNATISKYLFVAIAFLHIITEMIKFLHNLTAKIVIFLHLCATLSQVVLYYIIYTVYVL